MATLTHSGRAALAAALAAQPLYLAWGIGNADWEHEPHPEQVDARKLTHEVGRRLITQVYFVDEDNDGEIIVPTGKFRIVEEATRHLLIRVAYDFSDAAEHVIREIALFANPTIKSGLPPGQRYFLPSEVESEGVLVAIEHTTPIPRSFATRETFELVISL